MGLHRVGHDWANFTLIYLAALGLSYPAGGLGSSLRHAGSSSPIRDWTWAPCIGNELPGSPQRALLNTRKDVDLAPLSLLFSRFTFCSCSLSLPSVTCFLYPGFFHSLTLSVSVFTEAHGSVGFFSFCASISPSLCFPFGHLHEHTHTHTHTHDTHMNTYTIPHSSHSPRLTLSRQCTSTLPPPCLG